MRMMIIPKLHLLILEKFLLKNMILPFYTYWCLPKIRILPRYFTIYLILHSYSVLGTVTFFFINLTTLDTSYRRIRLQTFWLISSLWHKFQLVIYFVFLPSNVPRGCPLVNYWETQEGKNIIAFLIKIMHGQDCIFISLATLPYLFWTC